MKKLYFNRCFAEYMFSIEAHGLPLPHQTHIVNVSPSLHCVLHRSSSATLVQAHSALPLLHRMLPTD